MKDGLISFNNFFLASQNQETCMNIVRLAIKDPESIGILFIITIDTSISFVILNKIDSYLGFDQEILLPIRSVFRISDIKQIDNNVQLWQVKLRLVTNDDLQLGSIIKSMRKLVESKTDWYRLSELLVEVGEFDKSEEVYLAIINQTADDSKKADLYQQVGLLKKHRGDYIQTISFYEKALVIRQRILPSNHPNLLFSFKEIGEIHKSIREYSKAVWYYEKAFEIEQEIQSANHSLLTIICDTIGFLYSQLSEHSKALSFYEKRSDSVKMLYH
jgi:tetratricopeptide (TPR) repeat protein